MTDLEPFINHFADQSFRDSADQDYIPARIAYRREFDQKFRWCSLQAIEKYLKAIRLYNRVSSKGLSHNLDKALQRIYSISDLEFSLPSPDLEDFIIYISKYGSDRYLSHPTYLEKDAFFTLDKTVWCIRRYCFFMRQVMITPDGEKIEFFDANKKKATRFYKF